MIRSQIQLIADNMHRYHVVRKGDNLSIEMRVISEYASNTAKIVFSEKTFRLSLVWNEEILGLTNKEALFLEEVLRVISGKKDMVDYEELAEIFC